MQYALNDLTLFNFFSKSDADYTFQKFAALIGDENRPVNLDYENIVEKIYDADYIPVKFNDVENTLKTINREVASKTNGQIREALTRDELFKVTFNVRKLLNFNNFILRHNLFYCLVFISKETGSMFLMHH